jgi:uncharacterized protein YebE (UPF0316 family)
MTFIDTLHPGWLAVLIVCLRVFDVSLGTLRTLSVVHGRTVMSVTVGFIEILVWVTAVSQVITKMHVYPWLAVAYAGGFAMGNASGIWLERRLAIGTVAVRLITVEGDGVLDVVRRYGHVITQLASGPADDPHVLIYATCRRRVLPMLLDEARIIDPSLFYVIERFAETSTLAPLPEPTGWRALFKKK